MISRVALVKVPHAEPLKKPSLKPVLAKKQRPPLDNIANTEEKLTKRKSNGNDSDRDLKPLKALVDKANPVNSLVEAFSSQLIHDVDEKDYGNPQLVSIYVNDIYDYLRELETKNSVAPNFIKSPHITGRMRGILLDWLSQVALRFQLLPETFYLTVDIVDRFLQAQVVLKQKLQLVGIAGMFIAAKYEEMYSPPIGDYVYITDNAYSKVELRRMEITILKALDFNLGRPLPLHFLRRNSKAGEVDALTHTLAKYLMELAIIEYDTAHYAPSFLAAAALCLALKILHNMPWNGALEYHSKYNENELKPLMKKLAQIVLKSENHKLQAIREKFASSKFMRISANPKLKSVMMIDMAVAV